MAVIKPTATQLDIPSIATALATDGTITVTESQVSDLGDYVDLTSNQSVGGDKTYTGATTTLTGDILVQGDATISGTLTTQSSNDVNIGDSLITLQSELTGTPVLNAGIEIERGTSTNATIQWNEASDEWEAGIVGALSPIATESYVAGAFLPLTGGTMSGNLNIDLPTGNPAITFDRNGVDAGGVYSVNTYLLIRHENGSEDTEIKLFDTAISMNKRVTSLETTSGDTDTTLTTKGYVDSTFLPLSGGTVTGQLTIDGSVAAGTASDLLLQKFVTGVFPTQVTLKDDGIEVNRVLSFTRDTTTSDPTFSFTTRGYVDSGFLPISGGNLTGNLAVNRTGSGVRGFIINRGDVGEGALYQGFGGTVKYGDFQTYETVVKINKFNYDGGGALVDDTSLSIFDTALVANKEMRGPDATTNTGYVTKQQLDAVETNSASLDSTNIFTGNLEVDHQLPFVILDSDTGFDSILQFNENNTRAALVFHDASVNTLRQIMYEPDGLTTAAELSLSDAGNITIAGGTTVQFDVEQKNIMSLELAGGTTHKLIMRPELPTTTSSRTELELQAGNSSGAPRAVRFSPSPVMTASYTVVMPPAPPTVGQQLEVDTISGEFINMKWV